MMLFVQSVVRIILMMNQMVRGFVVTDATAGLILNVLTLEVKGAHQMHIFVKSVLNFVSHIRWLAS